MAQSPLSAFSLHALAVPAALFALALPGLVSAQPAPDGSVAPAFSETIPNVSFARDTSGCRWPPCSHCG